jgi:hypothetical protein
MKINTANGNLYSIALKTFSKESANKDTAQQSQDNTQQTNN